jgi:hypothetical protein
MTNDSIAVTIISSLISGLFAVAITLWFSNYLENRKAKIDTLRRLLGNRDDLTSLGFTNAANEVLVVFRDAPSVLAALQALHDTAVTPGKPNVQDKLVVLLKEAARAAGLEPKQVPDTAFLNVFTRAR